MTPVEELREAARLMRERAQKATTAPWTADGWEIHGYAHEWVAESLQIDDQKLSEANGTWIASMHPLVGLALADMLDGLAGSLDGRRAVALAIGLGAAKADESAEIGEPLALKLARLYLGRPS